MVQIRRRWGTVLLALILAYVLLLMTAPASQVQSSDDSDAQLPPGTSANSEHSEAPGSSNLLKKAEREGSVRVIVRLRTDFAPEGRLDRTDVANQRDGIESAQAGCQRICKGLITRPCVSTRRFRLSL